MSNKKNELSFDPDWYASGRFGRLVVDISGRELLNKTKNAINFNTPWEEGGYKGMKYAYEQLKPCQRVNEIVNDKEREVPTPVAPQKISKLGFFSRVVSQKPADVSVKPSQPPKGRG